MEFGRPSPEDYADPVDRKLVQDMDWQGVPSIDQLIPPRGSRWHEYRRIMLVGGVIRNIPSQEDLDRWAIEENDG